MRRIGPKGQQRIKLAVLAGLVVILGYVLAQYAFTRRAAPAASPTPVKGNTTKDEPSPSLTASPTAGTGSPIAPTTPPSAPTKPTLTKSSGNAGAIPAGVLVEFSCRGTAGAQCEVILTDRNNPNRRIALGSKTIADNGRGEYFATWEWTSVSGSWNVVAVSSNAGGSATSNTDTLEVN